MLPSGTRPSSSWTLIQRSGMKGSWQASGRFGRQPSWPVPKDAVLVDPDDGTDRGALGAFEVGESPVEVGWAEVLLAEQGPSLRAARRVEPVARLLE